MTRFTLRLCAILVGFAAPSLAAAARDTVPAWWFGVAGAANGNRYDGTTQRLDPQTFTPVPFHKGGGLGAFAALALEYRPHPVWGAMLQLGYDDRRGDFDTVQCPCGERASLSATPAYLSLEPSLRVAPWGGALHLFAGPRVARLWNPSGDAVEYRYGREGISETRGTFGRSRDWVWSAQVGAGYDVGWTPPGWRTRFEVSPFVSYQPWFGQNPRATPRDIELWTVSTVRLGAVLKFGRLPPSAPPSVGLTARAPARVVTRRTLHETFPLRDYVYFDAGSALPPPRYTALAPAEAAAFREEQLQDSLPAEPKGRSRRQLAVYHHLLNILGDRLRRNPGATLTLTGLTGPSAGEPALARARAESVKRYLTEAFGLDPARLTVDTRPEPPLPLGRPREDLDRLRAESRRVEIGSRSPEMLVQVGEGFMLKPVEIQGELEPSDSVTFLAPGAAALPEWWLDVANAEGAVRRFGPFTGERRALSGSMLLGASARDQYVATLQGRARNGALVQRQAAFSLHRRGDGAHRTTRFAILFDIDQARAVSSYEKFLRETVTAQMRDSAWVFIRGRTDLVGESDYNLRLSRDRAEGVRQVLQAETEARGGLRGVVFKPTWSGESPSQAPFGNDLPEERNYNRTVIIDILPGE
jgi:outer membrane protein OmpA-like peptidoglycan-associated protein